MGQSGSEELQKQIDNLKKQKEQLDAEKAKLEAEKALLESQRALDRAKADSSQQLTDLQNQKALATANKELEEAKKALEQAKTPSNQQLVDLQNKKALAEANKLLLETTKAVADAQKALELSKDPSNAQLSQLQNQKALTDAQKALAEAQKGLDQAKSASAQQLTDLQNQKALADAQKLLSESQTQATIAKYIGDVKAGPYSGSVDLKPNAGTEEALLLGAHAIKTAAERVASAVAEAVKSLGANLKAIHIFPAKEFPNFQRLRTYRFRKDLIKQAFASARLIKTSAKETFETVAAPALLSAGFEAFSKLLGFFKTDYTIGGIDVKIDESLLLYSVAGKLKGKQVHLPLVYSPTQNDAITDMVQELSELVSLREQAASEAQLLKKEIAKHQKEAETLNGAEKDALLETIEAIRAQLQPIVGAITLYDAFATSLTTPESNGTVPMSMLVQEYAIDKALKAGVTVLLLRLENSGGGYLLKKNLWTGLFAMPLYHMGGATVSYLLLAGTDGHVLAGDIVPIHGGFVRTDKISEKLNSK